MKKTLSIAAALVIASASAFAQGNVALSGTLHGIWNNTANGAFQGWQIAGAFDTTLLFAPASTVSALSGFVNGANGSGTNSVANNTTGALNYSVATAWTDVESDMGATWFQVNGAASAATVLATGTASGTFSYNSGTAWSAGNTTGGTTYSVYELSWYTGPSAAWTTLALAEANNAYIGWSKVVQYVPTTGAVAPTTLNAANLGYYGVGGLVPEPSTMALAGLGGLSLLLFRRRK